MQRRQFLLTSAALAAQAVGASVWAAPTAVRDSKLLVVLLRGGYDGASLLVPHASDFYYAVRPTIAIARPDAANPAAALDIGQGYGLHPAALSSFYRWYRAGQALAVPFCGSDDVSRSHFHAQDTMELGQGDRARLDYRSGFLNRLLQVLARKGTPRGGISFTGNLSLVFKGDVSVPNLTLKGTGHGAVDAHRTQMLEAMYRDRPLANAVRTGVDTRREVTQTLEQEMLSASRGARSAAALENAGHLMGTLMREHADYSVGFIDVGGWDTHIRQGAATGVLADRLDGLGRGLARYAEALQGTWSRAIVVLMSEFGRTVRENGDGGTDHGHGNTMWILGGGVSGGKVVGERVEVNEARLHEARDLPVLNSYRSVLADIMRRLYGLDSQQLAYVFPGVTLQDYGVL